MRLSDRRPSLGKKAIVMSAFAKAKRLTRNSLKPMKKHWNDFLRGRLNEDLFSKLRREF